MESCPKCGAAIDLDIQDTTSFICGTWLVGPLDDASLIQSGECKVRMKLVAIETIARKAIDAARHYPLWSWSDVETELTECETELQKVMSNA